MNFISGLLRFIAIFILIFVVLFLPFALFARNVGAVIFSPERIMELIDENVLDTDVAASMAQQLASGQIAEGEPDDSINGLMIAGIANFDHGDWIQMLVLIAPRALLNETLSQIITGFDEWIDSPAPRPQIQVEIKPWKNNIESNSVSVIELVMNALPQCNSEHTEAYIAIGVTGLNEDSSIPHCRPTEPLYSELLAYGSNGLPNVFANYPDEVNLGRAFGPSESNLVLLKRSLRRIRTFMRFSWLVLFGALTFAVVFGARSLAGYFKWTGWPLLLTGLGTLLLGIIMMISSKLFLGWLETNLFSELPRPLLEPMRNFTSGVLNSVNMPLIIQAVVLLALGGGTLILAVYMVKKAGALAINDTGDIDEKTDKKSEREELAAKAKEYINKKSSEKEDDDTPSGMFG